MNDGPYTCYKTEVFLHLYVQFFYNILCYFH